MPQARTRPPPRAGGTRRRRPSALAIGDAWRQGTGATGTGPSASRARIAGHSRPLMRQRGGCVPRFQKLAATSVALTLLLVTIGVVVRATGSGMGCPDWPLCYGNILPPLNDPNAWIEWTHRTVAAAIGFLILGLAVFAVRDHRDRPAILWGSLGAV